LFVIEPVVYAVGDLDKPRLKSIVLRVEQSASLLIVFVKRRMLLSSNANGTSGDGDFGESQEEPNCIDQIKHSTVKVGEVYFAENCLMCKCGAKEHPCQPVSHIWLSRVSWQTLLRRISSAFTNTVPLGATVISPRVHIVVVMPALVERNRKLISPNSRKFAELVKATEISLKGILLWCPPPTPCDGVITKDPRNCCDVCAPSVLLGNSIDHAGASLKLGGMTVTFLIIVSTIFFLLHRLRKKRLLITLRLERNDELTMRLQNYSDSRTEWTRFGVQSTSSCRSINGGFHPFRGPLDRSCGSCRVSTSCPRSIVTPSFIPPTTYADPPPPYSMAVMVPLASRGASNTMGTYSAPPPPYLCASRVSRSADNEGCCTNGACLRRNMPSRRSWPEFFVGRTLNWPLKRKVSQEVLGSRGHMQGSCSTSVADTGSVSSTCSSSSCSSNCDCDAYSCEERCSIYFDPAQTQQPSTSSSTACRLTMTFQPLNISIGHAFGKNCREQGIREAFVFVEEHVQFTFLELHRMADRLAAGLLAIGLSPKDRVCLWGSNRSQLLFALLACARAGFVFTLASPTLPVANLVDLLNSIKCKAIICFPSAKVGKIDQLLAEAVPELATSSCKGDLKSSTLPCLTHVIIASDVIVFKCAFSFDEVFNSNSDQKRLSEIDSQIDSSDLAAILLTSRTHGDQKPVRLSHYQLLNGCLSIGRRLALDSAQVLCSPLPLFRGPVMCLTVLSTIIFGCKAVIPSEQPLPAAIWRAIERFRCTCLLTSPVALSFMFRLTDLSKFDLSTLTTACLAGDPFPPDLLSMLRKTNISNIVTGMFLTEAGCAPIVSPLDEPLEAMISAVGKAADGFTAKVIDQQGADCPADTIGELWISPIEGSKFLGYQYSTNVDIDDNWIKTGDLAVIDNDGLISLVGKVKDVIYRRGSPAVGLSDSVNGESVCVCVVLKPNAEVDEADAKDIIKKLCSEQKLPPVDHVLILNELPRSTTRKVMLNSYQHSLLWIYKGSRSEIKKIAESLI
ncbi:AMP-binding enzyme, partial [Trichuris suis]